MTHAECRNKEGILKSFSFTFSSDVVQPTLGCFALGIPDAPLQANPEVAGSIGKPQFRQFWRETLKASKSVMSIIEEGYRIPFEDGQLPPSSDLPNNTSALNEVEFVKTFRR